MLKKRKSKIEELYASVRILSESQELEQLIDKAAQYPDEIPDDHPLMVRIFALQDQIQANAIVTMGLQPPEMTVNGDLGETGKLKIEDPAFGEANKVEELAVVDPCEIKFEALNIVDTREIRFEESPRVETNGIKIEEAPIVETNIIKDRKASSDETSKVEDKREMISKIVIIKELGQASTNCKRKARKKSKLLTKTPSYMMLEQWMPYEMVEGIHFLFGELSDDEALILWRSQLRSNNGRKHSIDILTYSSGIKSMFKETKDAFVCLESIEELFVET